MTHAPGPRPHAPLLEARGVSLRIGARSVLEDVDVTVRAGEIVTLVGPNGAGKTTLLRVLLGILPPSAGAVARAPGLRIGYAPQHVPRDPMLPLTVRRFLTLGAARAGAAELRAALEEVGARALAGRPLAALSGGELQRVLLARALLRRPALLVLDEPLAGVDVGSQQQLYRLIATLRDRHGCGVLLVSHDLHLVMAETDTVLCLNGHVCCSGPPRSVVRDPAFVSLFGAHLAGALSIYEHAHDHAHNHEADAREPDTPRASNAPDGPR